MFRKIVKDLAKSGLGKRLDAARNEIVSLKEQLGESKERTAREIALRHVAEEKLKRKEAEHKSDIMQIMALLIKNQIVPVLQLPKESLNAQRQTEESQRT